MTSDPARDSDSGNSPRFYQADVDDILAGRTADVYFERTVQILEQAGINPHVRAEFAVKSLPGGFPWAVFAGLEEVFALLEGRDLTLRGVPEGALVRPYEPIFEVSGNYLTFARFETAILGLICQASGVATKAARIRHMAGDRLLVSFGARRMHPSVAPVIERSAYIGGCDGVSVIMSAELLGADPTGTMPHALILVVGDTVEAMRLYDEIIEPDIPRIALIDTFQDEKFEAMRVAEALGKRLVGIRLDTPGSRRGDFARIIEEVRWELDLRGHQHVQIVVSGGLDEESVLHLRPIVDAFGVGTTIANAPTIDFGMDIVEIEGKAIAKRGKMSGAKQLWRDPVTLRDRVLPLGALPEIDGLEAMFKDLMVDGQLADALPTASEIRARVLQQLALVGDEIS